MVTILCEDCGGAYTPNTNLGPIPIFCTDCRHTHKLNYNRRYKKIMRMMKSTNETLGTALGDTRIIGGHVIGFNRLQNEWRCIK